jgi:hypothetical protein
LRTVRVLVMDEDLDEALANKKCRLIDLYMSEGIDPTLPCIHPPGSPQKVAVVAARWAAGLDPLFHPEDADHSADLIIEVDDDVETY